MASDTYRVRQFAEMAGVTVRALHHYDRLGLLKPRRTANGYRLYSTKDLETLEQIVALRFIGLPLDRIKLLLRRSSDDIAAALRVQRELLEQKKALLEQAIKVLGESETLLQTGSRPNTKVFKKIIEVIEMQNKSEEWSAEYARLVQGKIERLREMSLETRAELRSRWTDLLKDVEAALGEEPGSPRAQELANRWATLLEAFAPSGKVDPELLKRFGGAYQPPNEWPSGVRAPEGPLADKRIWEFIRKALAVRQ